MRLSAVGIGVALATQLSVVALSPAAPVAARAASPRVTATSSLPAVNSGARPGPDLLYAAPPDAPQLQNVAPWHADPVLVSGAEAYRGGEFLYQDYLFDDRGAVGFAPIFPIVADPTDPFDPVANLFSPKHGTVTYPTDTATYANNAADLVELRVKPETNDTAFRVTLNSLKDAGKVGFTIALGTSASALPWPASAGVKSPAEFFLTVHGATGTLVHAVGLTPVAGPAPTVAVDLARRQVDVRVPHSLWTPTATVRMAAGVGLWDTTANIYAQPGAVASATQPGGCPTGCPALFNMAFRTAEPLPKIYSPGGANTIAEGGVGVKIDGTWWREKQQADVLATGDVTPFSALVDFTKLGNGTNEELGPRSGHLDRIMASHFSFGQGVDYNVKCFPSNPAECTGRLIGQLQPYAVYVPAKPIPAAGFGLVLSMHGLSANFNEFLGSHEAEQLGNRGTGSILASPEGRGPDGFYHYYAEADAFEMWADLARHYKLNPDLTDVSGYSMGGEGTYLLATRWPDLFGKAFPIVGPPSSSGSYKSLRNIPVMAWYGQTDELVGPQDSEQSFLNAFQAGIRYDHWVFTPAGHITEGNNDEYTPAAVFLGNTTVDRSPPHVTYFRDPSLDTRALSAPDHAYWVSGITLASGSATGTIDAKSHGFGVDDAPVLAPQLGAGILTGGSHPLGLPYTERILSWGATPSAPVANRLDVTVSGVSAATVDLARARLDCNVDLHVVTDVTTTIHFTSCSRVVTTAANYGPNALGGGGLPNTSPGGPLGPVVVLIVVVMGGGAALAARRVRQYNPWGLNRR